jgi:uncharacterized protein
LILVDSNIFMYAAGAHHPFKRRSTHFLEGVAEGKTEAAVDAETLQEILHRYRSLRRWSEGCLVYDMVRTIFPEAIPITGEIVDRARILLDEYNHLMARDALHAAVAEAHSLGAICSFDRDFDRIQNIHRIEP